MVPQGFLLKYAGRLHGWKKRWCYLAGTKFYYAKDATSALQVEVPVAGSSVAEESDRNPDNGFEVNAPATKVRLRCDSRPEMEQWMAAFRTASAEEETVTLENTHLWYLKTNKGRHCNVCGHGLSKQKRSVVRDPIYVHACWVSGALIRNGEDSSIEGPALGISPTCCSPLLPLLSGRNPPRSISPIVPTVSVCSSKLALLFS